MAASDAYDDLPYTDHAYAEAHPDRLAVVARLSGWAPPDVETARVLELGCGRGGNLLPMASALPRATLVGVDRSQRQIAEARTIAQTAGLSNARFVDASFDALDPGSQKGSFDYVIAHGVASWVPPSARRELLRAVARALAPSGVAYVSFNALPGWYERMAARDWLRLGSHEDPRASLAWLLAHASHENADYRRRLGAVARRLDETEPAYVTHEYLADEHHPQLIGSFLAEASEAGLAYLGDAIAAEAALELLDSDVRDRARGLDVSAAQQLVDFVRNTAFRRTLLVRADHARFRAWKWSPALELRALDGLRLASRLRPRADTTRGAPAETFDSPDVSVQVDDPVARRALRELARVAPRSLPLSEVARLAGADDSAALRKELFDLWLATGALDLHAHEPALTVTPSERPVACPVARWHALHGGVITNLWHHQVRLDEVPLRRVLGLLDGTRGANDVARAADCTLEVAHASIRALAAAALLLAG